MCQTRLAGTRLACFVGGTNVSYLRRYVLRVVLYPRVVVRINSISRNYMSSFNFGKTCRRQSGVVHGMNIRIQLPRCSLSFGCGHRCTHPECRVYSVTWISKGNQPDFDQRSLQQQFSSSLHPFAAAKARACLILTVQHPRFRSPPPCGDDVT